MNNDGKDAYQLTAFKGPVVISGTWSPDDTKLGCHISLGQDQDIYFLNTTTGNATRLTFGGKHFVRRWSADGRWLYFAKVHDGVSTLQKVNVASGEVVEVAADGANAAAESLDGRYVYFVRASSGGIWRAPTGGGQAELIADSSVFSGISKSNFVENRNGIYLFDNARKSDEVVRYLDLSTGAIRILSKNPIGAGFSFDVSPDGKQILSSRTDYLATEIVRIGR